MSTQKAVMKTAKGQGNVEIREVEEPIPKSNEVKIKVKAAGICGSGPGTIGLLTLQVVKAEGATVIMCGTSKDKKRLDLAKTLGADMIVDIQSENLKKIIDKTTNGDGVDVVFECSGSAAAANLGLEIIRKKGKYTQMGGFGSPIQINFDKITYKEIQLTGSFSQKWSAWKRAIKLLSEKKVRTKPLVTTILPITDWKYTDITM